MIKGFTSFSLPFWIGLFLRIGLVVLAVPAVQEQSYLPFLLHPASWVNEAVADPGAFPFGIPYRFVFGLAVQVGHLFFGVPGAHLAFGLTILCCDLLLLLVIKRICLRYSNQDPIPFYWLSPVILYVGYWHGSPHVLSALLLAAAMACILEGRYQLTGALFGLSVAATPATGLAAPFLGFYFLARSRLREVAGPSLLTAIIVAGTLIAAGIVIPGLRSGYVEFAELLASLNLAILLSGGLHIFVLPMAYLVLVYIGWRVRNYNFELLWNFIGVLFTGFSLFMPTAPGLAVWALPFLAIHAANTELTGRVIFWVYSLSFVGLHLLTSIGPTLFHGIDLTQPFAPSLPQGQALASALFTISIGSGALFLAQMLRRGVFRSWFYLSSQRPLGIGIGGDSGAGKDDLVNSVIGIFGSNAVAHISGDNYHRWDRQRSMWRALTHLNPKANDLEAFSRDMAELMERRWVRARHYDHSTGRMSKPARIHPREIVVASGLHALWMPRLTSLYDVKIFLQMDEDLRRYFKLRRDVRDRGHAPERVLQSLDHRRPDSIRFIQPQGVFADLIFRLEPRKPDELQDVFGEKTPGLQLVVRVPREDDYSKLVRLLLAICDVQAVERTSAAGVEILIIGEPTRDEVRAVANRLISDDEILAVEPAWERGVRGLMQLFVLDRIERARQLRVRKS
ncbi:hypothetical protein JQ582_39175 [Bradyrhizobium japonicum]|uniref:hypothetical protein n=1 Tax=Bradyrhizobium japonicum TaxID=375 RepID=UPI001BAADA30|nr:hypothetical protein [Bradyrhizobium japonicum]MBR0749950.1 hypothetical protein [Bradyrhizobium japonicum]